MYDTLKEQVCHANLLLPKHHLVTFTWGNVSQIDRNAHVIAIKPSGVDYDHLTPDKIVIIDLNGHVLQGKYNPSSDTPTHIELYKHFKSINGICHTHSPKATMWAQACKEIPCLGTTHADYFHGPVPVTQPMTPDKIDHDYETNTGKVIVSRFQSLDPEQIPAVLVANHGPFTWGSEALVAVEYAIVLEQLAEMAMGTQTLNPKQEPIPQVLLDKHYTRKHGPHAYYGQK